MARVIQLNHAVLYVSDPGRSAEFYKTHFGFEEVDRMGDSAVFLKGAGSDNHHELAVMRAQAPAGGRGAVGLYHLAWEVETIEDLAEMASDLGASGSLVGMSDHGVSKSLYAVDPDGIEFEVMWRVPRSHWGDYERKAVVMPLDLKREVERFGTKARGTPGL